MKIELLEQYVDTGCIVYTIREATRAPDGTVVVGDYVEGPCATPVVVDISIFKSMADYQMHERRLLQVHVRMMYANGYTVYFADIGGDDVYTWEEWRERLEHESSR